MINVASLECFESFPIVILGGGVVAGYAAKEFVAQSGKKEGLAIVTAENALDADHAFTMLMGEEVGPRKTFIQTQAKNVKNLDI